MTREEEIYSLAREHAKELCSCYQSFVLGAYYADKTMIEKVCEWFYNACCEGLFETSNIDGLVDNFKQTMEE